MPCHARRRWGPRNGEGARFLAAVAADAAGRFVFPAGTLACPESRRLTLTATRAADPPVTSEFSTDVPCEPLEDPPATPGPTDAPPPTPSLGPSPTPTPSPPAPTPRPTCHLVQTDGRRLCAGTCPVTGEECRALGYNASCACQPVASFSPCGCITGIQRCSSSVSGCKHPDEICTIPGGEPRFDLCEPGDCQCIPDSEIDG